MPLYCGNKETNWLGFDHEVHRQRCSKWPSKAASYLGDPRTYDTCDES